jgi:exonuclease VII large subunit
MPESNPQETLQKAIHRYLSTLSAIGDCLSTACPQIGGPYKHRFSRMRARLAFDANPASMDESYEQIDQDLKQYSGKAAEYLANHKAELRHAVHGLEEIIHLLANRQEFYSARLRQVAGQLQQAEHPSDLEQMREALSAQAASLSVCLESMYFDTQSLVAGMQEELLAVESRITESETTDPVTGLMNRREMERQIEHRRSAGERTTLLLLELKGTVTEYVAQQVATRLWSHFRPKDMISRWAPEEFLVLFQGPPEVAEMRVNQVVPWIAGKYPLESGEICEIQVEARFMEPEMVSA